MSTISTDLSVEDPSRDQRGDETAFWLSPHENFVLDSLAGTLSTIRPQEGCFVCFDR